MATCVLTVAILFSTGARADQPLCIKLEGTVWDFKDDHPDFGAVPVGGNGHIAGNIAQLIGVNGRPAFSGGGFKVAVQWRDQNGNQIAPHLCNMGGQLKTVHAPNVAAGAVLDSWNSGQGPYGGGNVGASPSLLYPVSMPSIDAPIGMPQAYGPNPVFSGSSTINTNFHCLSITLDAAAEVIVDGDVTIRCLGSIVLANNAKIKVLTGSRLTIYHQDSMQLGQAAEINFDSNWPSRCRIFNTSSQPIVLNQDGRLCAEIVSPFAELQLQQNDHFYGTFIGDRINLGSGSGFHWDGIPTNVCGTTLADVAGTAGSSSTAAITSASSFEQWYTDTLGVNLSAKHTIELVQNDAGIYEFVDDDFFPVDNMLFGNQGQSHNYFFTYSLRTTFVHEACESEARFFEFQGADDAWLYINGKLAIDLGGVIPNVVQRLDMDRLGLADGENCTFEFFFAQRQSALSIFRMRTNVPLESVVSYDTVSASVD